MGHFVFLVLHVVALLFSAWALILTIPLHVIYAAMASRSNAERAQADNTLRELAQQVRCPECRELVRWDAVKCKHCGAQLTPSAAAPTNKSSNQRDDAVAISVAVVAIVSVIALAKSCS